jgi:hypothetical protein
VLPAVAALVGGFVTPAWSFSGWQPTATYDVPTGLTSLFYHYPCPSGSLRAVSGGFATNSIGQTSNFSLGFDGPRLDESPPSFHEWGWHFYWPAGAPAGVTINFSVYCN